MLKQQSKIKIVFLTIFAFSLSANAILSEICPIDVPEKKSIPYTFEYEATQSGNEHYKNLNRCEAAIEVNTKNGFTNCECTEGSQSTGGGFLRNDYYTVSLKCLKPVSISALAAKQLICSSINLCIVS